jgi:pimeloyl-ACP methyl ester carboxylesterase
VAVECGYLTVPEDRSGDPADTILIAYAEFNSRAASPAADAVVYLEGGPGGSGLDSAPALYPVLIEPLLATRDVLVLDQRGSGHSLPQLQCPETWDVDAEDNLTPEARKAEMDAALAVCKARLEQAGANPAAYTTTANADDVADLVRSLGYDQATLYGGSYGTKLALALMRRHPELVRAAVLDGVSPLEINTDLALNAKLAAAYDLLFGLCEQDEGCAAAYPELRARFFALADKLNAEPAPYTIRVDGEKREQYLSGDDLLAMMFVLLFLGPDAIGMIPMRIAQMEAGNFAVASSLDQLMRTLERSISDGMMNSINCAEETLLNTPEALEAAVVEFPEYAGVMRESFLLTGADAIARCRAWGAEPAEPGFSAAVTSTIPTLLLAGQLDVQTPVAWARQAAASLPNGRLIELPWLGHVAAAQHICPAGIVVRFIEDPAAELDTSCIEKLRPPRFFGVDN